MKSINQIEIKKILNCQEKLIFAAPEVIREEFINVSTCTIRIVIFKLNFHGIIIFFREILYTVSKIFM